MPQKSSRESLRSYLGEIGGLSNCCIWDTENAVDLRDLADASVLGGSVDELRGRSVLVATGSQLSAALALIELDGTARRLVLCPSDFKITHLAEVMSLANADVIVSDGVISPSDVPAYARLITCSSKPEAAKLSHEASQRTEWILLTSGTTGLPKLVAHTLESLSGAIGQPDASADPIVWSTFYDIRRYGGLQIFLRAIITRTSLVLSSPDESTAQFLFRCRAHGVTNISGTPSHWRRALMSPEANTIAPRYVRLSGEIADQTILDSLSSTYPDAKITHAFASTEAGVAFEVNDGLAGFPKSMIHHNSDVKIKVEDGSLRIHSARIADRYLNRKAEAITRADGFVDTGDIVELRGDRYHFAGRRDGVINVGGLKVHPEEVEAVINRHPSVQVSLVRTRKNPITGALVVADVVLKVVDESLENPPPNLQREILRHCREALPSHKVPATINFVPNLTVAETGKMMRPHA